MRSWKAATVLLVLGEILGFLGAGVIPLGKADPSDPPKSSAPIPKELTSYRDVVKKVLPAVVSIRVVTAKKGAKTDAAELGGDQADPELRRFMDEFRRRRGAESEPSPIGQFGSGVIVDPIGIVVTNNHVVTGAEEVEVRLKDGKPMRSKSVYTDPRTDLAVIKLNTGGSPLPYAEFGDSDEMEIGDRVLAVGAPFGLTGTVTHGIISAKGRSLNMNLYEDFLQTDAAINPGNSGGPLVNLAGQVVGINSAIKSQSGGFQGVGMAIPSVMVKEVVSQLAKDGVVRRGYLGVSMRDLTPELAERLKVDEQKGVVIMAAQAGAPGAKAGMKEGDIILAIGGKPIDDGKILQRMVRTAPLGKALDFDILRDGKRQSVKVTIEAMPDDFGVASVDQQRRQPGFGIEGVPLAKLGAEVADLSPEIAEQLGYKDLKGALVTNVEPNGIAALGGLRRGMLITGAERKSVDSANALKEIVTKGSLVDGIMLRVRTPQGRSREIILKSDI
jgi:serine protease Do